MLTESARLTYKHITQPRNEIDFEVATYADDQTSSYQSPLSRFPQYVTIRSLAPSFGNALTF